MEFIPYLPFFHSPLSVVFIHKLSACVIYSPLSDD
jgi:hypothetical protein